MNSIKQLGIRADIFNGVDSASDLTFIHLKTQSSDLYIHLRTELLCREAISRERSNE